MYIHKRLNDLKICCFQYYMKQSGFLFMKSIDLLSNIKVQWKLFLKINLNECFVFRLFYQMTKLFGFLWNHEYLLVLFWFIKYGVYQNWFIKYCILEKPCIKFYFDNCYLKNIWNSRWFQNQILCFIIIKLTCNETSNIFKLNFSKNILLMCFY